MKGLLLKDFYITKDNLLVMMVSLLAIGTGMSFVVAPSIVIIIASTMFSIAGTSTINLDKTSKWDKLSVTMPVTKKEIILSKYVIYCILGLIGLVVGGIVAIILSVFKGEFEMNNFLIYVVLGIIVPLISGSVSIPGFFLLSEEKASIVMILSYTATGGILAGVFLLVDPFFSLKDNFVVFGTVLFLFALLLFAASFVITNKIYSKKDI